MSERKWVLHRDPANKYGGVVTLGERNVQVPMPGLVYAELSADMQKRYAQTMLVWSGRELSAFNKGGAHSFARRFFGWVLLGGQVHHHSLHWPANGHIPTQSEVEAVLKSHGKLYIGGELLRKPGRPSAAETAQQPAATAL